MSLTQGDLQQIKTIVEEVVETKLEVGLKPIHKKLNKLQKDLDTTIRYFDHEVPGGNPPIAL